MQRPVVQAVCAAVAALVLAACGGSSGPSEAEVTYAARANKAVELFAKRLAQVGDGFGSASTRGEDLAVLMELEGTTADVAARLRNIAPPAGERKAHDRLIGDVERYGAVVRRARGTFASKDPQTVLKARNDLAGRLEVVNRDIRAAVASINTLLQD